MKHPAYSASVSTVTPTSPAWTSIITLAMLVGLFEGYHYAAGLPSICKVPVFLTIWALTVWHHLKHDKVSYAPRARLSSLLDLAYWASFTLVIAVAFVLAFASA